MKVHRSWSFIKDQKRAVGKKNIPEMKVFKEKVLGKLETSFRRDESFLSWSFPSNRPEESSSSF